MDLTDDGKRVKEIAVTECVFTHYTGQSRGLRMFAKEVLALKNMDIMTDEQLECEIFNSGYIPMVISRRDYNDEEIILIKREAILGAPVIQR